ncbi:MAG: carboxypeptidase-like regulatory domain-containing protein [Saprospiraceae bacterium]|nr:carboxypeptidase-like regulatory domain-containing protein [Saprospiraceae bacterium]
MQVKSILNTFFFTFLTFAFQLSYAQKMTLVKGSIFDAKTKEAMLYVNVQFDNTSIGTMSELDGTFQIETNENVSKISISYIGYKTQLIDITSGQVNDIKILMEDEAISLNEVVVKSEKYKNKGNPAVELIKNVIAHKDRNRKEGFDYFSFNKHEKVEFSLNNITDKMRNNFFFKRINFIFENADTNKITGKINLPVFLKENISDVYFRKEPSSTKEYIRAEKITNIDEIFNNAGISTMMSSMYQDVDFYDNTIMLLTNGFVSPLSGISPNIYRFYIQDTTVINGTSMIHIYFAPRTKTDLAFMGHMWVANDSTYALRKIDAGIPKDINLNWVKDLQIVQEYDWVNIETESSDIVRGLMLKTDDIMIDFGTSKKDNTRSVMGRKSTTYQRVTVNEPLDDTLFDFAGAVYRETDASKKPLTFWNENRHVPLTESEMGIYQMVDSLNNHKPFKRIMTIGRLLFEGYTPIGGFNLGPANTFYSFNPIEGFRLRLGGRTNLKFSEKMMFEGYGAYGFKDEKFKGYASLRYNFGANQMLRFPYNQLKIWYQDDIKIPGQDLQFIQEDNILLSIKRGVNDKMIYTQTKGIEYLRESQSGFSYSLTARNTVQTPAGALLFDYDSGENRKLKSEVMSSELGLMLRYAPNEKFYEGATYRTPILNSFPVFEFRYTAGLKVPNSGEYNYHNVNLKAKKVFYLAPFGFSELIVEGGKIFGQVPYTLLTAHRANQTFAYQLESYNLMNFLEFVSDKYVSVNYQHNFQGVFFGRMPLIKNLKWREVISFKGLWGSLDDQNKPDASNELLRFPVDQSGRVLTNTLENKPYIETSIGISNIFKVLRVDYVRRINYTDLPNVSKWGIRARVKFEF